MKMSTQKQKIGIIGAMAAEVALLKKKTEIRSCATIAAMEFCEGSLDGRDVVIVQCGMGKVNAAICAHTLIHHFRCTEIINTGVAGSLDHTLDIGDFVICVDAVQHDFDVSPIGFRPGEIPFTKKVAFPADLKLREEALAAVAATCEGAKVYEGRICSGDQFINQIAQKESIVARFGGLCCEMEGAAVAQVCYLSHTPFVIIRCISDKPDGSVIADFETFAKDAAVKGAKAVEYMLTH